MMVRGIMKICYWHWASSEKSVMWEHCLRQTLSDCVHADVHGIHTGIYTGIHTGIHTGSFKFCQWPGTQAASRGQLELELELEGYRLL